MSDLQTLLTWIENERIKETVTYKLAIRTAVDKDLKSDMRAELNGIIIGLDMTESKVKEMMNED